MITVLVCMWERIQFGQVHIHSNAHPRTVWGNGKQEQHDEKISYWNSVQIDKMQARGSVGILLLNQSYSEKLYAENME